MQKNSLWKILSILGLVTASSANAFTINPVFDSTWMSSAPTAATQDVQAVATQLASLFTNTGSVTISFGWNEVNGQAVSGTTAGATLEQFYGQSGTSVPLYSLSTVKSLLSSYSAANPQNTVLSTEIANIPGSVSNANGYNLFALPEAQYIALTGSSFTGNSAYIGFGGSLNWQYSEAGGIASNAYDFNSVLFHEITHALGRVDYSTTTGAPYFVPYDLTRYNCGTTTLNSTQSSPACFSYNGGVTDLATFSSTDDPGDWASTAASGVPSTAGSTNNAYISPGTLNTMLTVDNQTMQALGYTYAPVSSSSTSSPIPIPGTGWIFASGMLLVGLKNRKFLRKSV